MAQYPGTNILRGYRKHFGVDFECALKELALLGITFDAQHISQWRQSLRGQQEHRRRRREAQLNEDKVLNEEWSLFLQAMGMDSEAHEESNELSMIPSNDGDNLPDNHAATRIGDPAEWDRFSPDTVHRVMRDD